MNLNLSQAVSFVGADKVNSFESAIQTAQQSLENGTCTGNDFLGWLHLPSQTSSEFLADIKATAQLLRQECDAVVVAGIGGSYLGAKAVIEALSDSFGWLKPSYSPRILFAGNNIGGLPL